MKPTWVQPHLKFILYSIIDQVKSLEKTRISTEKMTGMKKDTPYPYPMDDDEDIEKL